MFYIVWERLGNNNYRTMRIEAANKQQAIKVFLAYRPYTKHKPIVKARQTVV